MRLNGKTALITGAARGIGRAFAEAYVREGARVAIGDINLAAAEKTAAEIGPNAIAVHLDVTNQVSIDTAVTETVHRLGHIDILINNAALFEAAAIADITRASYDKLFAVNVSGTLFTLQAVARHMIARGESLVAVYCATKAAVISLTQSAGLNLIAHGINVNAIAPGVVDGDHWDGVDAYFAKLEGLKPGEKKKLVGAAVPFGRMGTAADLTGMAIFLATSEADYIVAQTYYVDGGNWMS